MSDIIFFLMSNFYLSFDMILNNRVFFKLLKNIICYHNIIEEIQKCYIMDYYPQDMVVFFLYKNSIAMDNYVT